MAVIGNSVGEMIEFINGSGLGAIGTPDACAAQIERLWQQSSGGFGAYLLLAHNWANPSATLRSYELIAREVMPRSRATPRPRLMLHAAPKGSARASPRPSRKRSKTLGHAIRPS